MPPILSPVWDVVRGMLVAVAGRLPAVAAAIIIFVLFYLTGLVARSVIRDAVARVGRRRNVGLVLGRLTQWVLVFVGLLVALVVILPSFRPVDLIRLLGISSVAIGFAFRDILQNFLAGILLLLTEPFRLGDQIVYDDYEGTVTNIETRATTIRTYDGRRVVIPNADLFTNVVTVNTAFEQRRWQCDIGVAYSDDIERAKRLIIAALAGVDGVLAQPPPDALVTEFNPDAVVIRATWWTMPPTRRSIFQTQDAVLMAIRNSLRANRVPLPAPVQQVSVHLVDTERRAVRTPGPPSRSAG